MRGRPIVVLGAPSSIGIRPYDDGGARRLDLAPGALRDQGLVARLGAGDRGDVVPPPYVDFARPGMRPRNEEGVALYSRALAREVAAASGDGAFVLVLGGDCSIVLGCLLGLRRYEGPPVGLAYLDAHADYASPDESRTGSAASMCLGLAVGRGDTPLARLRDGGELVRPADVALVGRRDHAEPWYGHDALRRSAVLDLPHAAVRARGAAATAHEVLERLAAIEGGFWIHLDADLFDPRDVPAVDSPEPDGLRLLEVAELLAPLVAHPRALGMELTIYDPALDPERTSAARLADLLADLLADGEPRP